MQPPILRAHPAAEVLTDERCHILELSNSPDDPEMSIARARVEPGVTTRWLRTMRSAFMWRLAAAPWRLARENR